MYIPNSISIFTFLRLSHMKKWGFPEQICSGQLLLIKGTWMTALLLCKNIHLAKLSFILRNLNNANV